MTGARHQEIISQVVEDLEELPEERLEEVRDFVEFLKGKSMQSSPRSISTLLDALGTWDGPPGELDELVSEIYEARHQEE